MHFANHSLSLLGAREQVEQFLHNLCLQGSEARVVLKQIDHVLNVVCQVPRVVHRGLNAIYHETEVEVLLQYAVDFFIGELRDLHVELLELFLLGALLTVYEHGFLFSFEQVAQVDQLQAMNKFARPPRTDDLLHRVDEANHFQLAL